MRIYQKVSEIEKCPALIGHVRPLLRAWEEFGLKSILCVNNTPTLFYSKSQTILSAKKVWETHRKFWNQGIASVLVIADPKTAYVLSGLEPPSRVDAETTWNDIPALVQSIEITQFSKADLFESVSNGGFYREYAQKFRSTGLIDEKLNANLRALRALLLEDKNNPVDELTAHNFICRLLFVCYLIDRGIYHLTDSSTPRHLHQVLQSIPSEKLPDFLYTRFNALKKKFNGSMFDQDLPSEKQAITPHLSTIVAFLRGDEVASGQGTLGFWAYDFRLIPIETISGIYETFLTEDDRKSKGAHYTPRLLAELTVDVACQDLSNWDKCKFLDPCCGSGVFIVTLFNRLATAWELKHKNLRKQDNYYQLKADALLSILENQIRGIDLKETAGKLACFSLYVALLDTFDPTDIQTYIEKTGKKLPTLFRSKKGKHPEIAVVYEDDSLNSKYFKEADFDVVVGNPPWGGSASKEQSHKFMRHANKLMSKKGQSCLLLPSKIFLNLRSDKFQADWFSQYTVDRIIQLADYRFILFPTAKSPCMLVKFREGKAEANHRIIYDTPKVDISSKRKGFIKISAPDRKEVIQEEVVLAAKQGRAHEIWKRLFWGTPRDKRLLNYLSTFSKLSDITGRAEAKNKRWLQGQGVKPDPNQNAKTPSNPWWEANMLYIDARSPILASSRVLLKTDCEEVGDRFIKLDRNREKSKVAFQPPIVIVSQGFGKVLFCDFPVLFQHSLQSIHGPEKDKKLLAFLAAYLQSSLAKYVCFYTSSKLGIERNVVRFEELLSLPFPLPSDAPAENAQAIVDKVWTLYNEAKTKLQAAWKDNYDKKESKDWVNHCESVSSELSEKLEGLVFNYFGLLEPESILVEDTVNIFEPSATPRSADSPTLMQESVADSPLGLNPYIESLTSTLNTWAEEQDSQWCVNAFSGISTDSNIAAVRLNIVKKQHSKKSQAYEIDGDSYRKLLEAFTETQATCITERQVIGFLNGSFYVLRPLALHNWTRSRALNDADEFFSQYLRIKESEG